MTVARCGFCHRTFKTKQGVRGHLRSCERYSDAKRQGRPPKSRATHRQSPTYIGRPQPKADLSSGFDPAAHMKQQVEEQESRLKLRQVQAAHEELDRKEVERARQIKEQAEAVRRREQDEILARRRTETEAQERREKERREGERQRQRRELLQSIKNRVVRNYIQFLHVIPKEAEARALKQIEQELMVLPIEDLPERELVELAEGIRDGIYRAALRGQDEERRQEEEAARQRRKREAEQWEQEWRERELEQKRNQKKRELVRHGYQFAAGELDERGIRPSIERYAILEKLEKELNNGLLGEESKSDTEDLVEEILARVLPKTERGRR